MGASSDRRRARRGLAVLVVLVVTLAGCADDDAASTPSTSGTTDTTATTTSTSTSTSVAEVAVEAERALLSLADLPDRWSVADNAVGEVDPATGFCERFVSVRAIDVLRTRPFAATPSGPWLVSGVAVFDSARAAGRYLSAIDATLDCPGWTADSGVEHRVDRMDLGERDVHELRAYTQETTVEGASFALDIVYLRVDRVVSFVTRTWRVDDPARGGDGAVELDAVVDVAARRLHAAVRP